MTDLNALMLFAKVVEANSFSEAARRLKIPASTVSRRIAELEDQLGVTLIVRSTRSLRLTDVGAEVFEHAQRSSEISETVDSLVSNKLTKVSGLLRLSAPPNISDSFLTPMVSAFQASYPNVKVRIFIADRYVDHMAEGVDLVFRRSALKDSSLVARRLLSYRHQLVASPDYLKTCRPPKKPSDLLDHCLLAFWHGRSPHKWHLEHVNKDEKETLSFHPFLAMNDYAGLAAALLAGAGIGDLPPVCVPHLTREGRLVEVMPNWRFHTLDLSIVHLGSRHLPRVVRLFKELSRQ